MLRDEYGDASLILSQKRCPMCSARLVQLGDKKPPLPIQIIAAVRDADLTPAELFELPRRADGGLPGARAVD
jgi:hypothetical protein